MPKKLPKSYSEELGINLKSKKEGEIFKWFFAAILFGARISGTIAKNTYRQFEKERVLSPDKILATGWHGLVDILDAGGYTRYDFSTADDLLAVAKLLNKKYAGKLTNLHKMAKDSRDLEKRLQELRGVGPTTTNIFLRELRGIWPKADPALSPLVELSSKKLKIPEKKIKANVRLEAALVRAGKKLRKAQREKSKG